jgi:hypothetical protein
MRFANVADKINSFALMVGARQLGGAAQNRQAHSESAGSFYRRLC